MKLFFTIYAVIAILFFFAMYYVSEVEVQKWDSVFIRGTNPFKVNIKSLIITAVFFPFTIVLAIIKSIAGKNSKKIVN